MYQNDDFNDKNFNQDNSQMWVNPMLQDKKFRLLVLICFLPMLFAVVYFIKTLKLNDFSFIDNFFLLIEILILIFSIINVIYNQVKTRVSINKLEKENSDNVDFEYYKNILNEMSVGVLSFCYNKKVNYADTLISLLLILEKNKYIKIDIFDKKIIFLNKETSELNEHEDFFYNSITKNNHNHITFDKLNNIINNDLFAGNFINLIKVDVKKQEYFTTKNFSNDMLKYILLFNFILMIIAFIINQTVGLFYFFTTFILFMLFYIVQRNVYVKTKKGNDVNSKLLGLKKFIIDFSVLPQRKIEELIIWDYYMIYAIIFNLKGNLNNDVNKLYDLIKSSK